MALLPRTLMPLVLALVLGAGAHAVRPGAERVENFALLDHTGRFHELYYYADAAAVVLFVQGNGCPIARNSLPVLEQLRAEFASRGVVFLLLNANTQDDRRSVAAEAREYAIDFPILVDETQLIAESLGITRTAEALLIDPRSWRIVYRGPLDDRLGYETQKPARHHYLGNALTTHLSGKPVAHPVRDSKGCLIFFPDRDAAAHGEISYAEDVAPLLERRCRSCHRPQGVAPWSMSSYEMVRGWSPMMREMIRTRRMPPWHADPHVGTFANDGSLRAEEARTLVHWIEAGAPRGSGPDPLRDSPARERKPWPQGEPDLVLEVPEQRIPPTGVVPYRYETVDVPLAEDVWIRGVDLRPSNARVMHHGTAHIVPPDGGATPATLGFRFTRGLFAGYVPGREPYPLPDDSGFFLPAGSKIRFQLHYTTTGRPERDAPRLALYLSRQPLPYELKIGAAVNFDFEIPPGAEEHVEEASLAIDRDILLYRLAPHMHYRGKWMTIDARHPDGSTERLLSVPNYNIQWQRQYVLAEPVRLAAGTRLVCRAAFDNSDKNPANPDPESSVSWGEQSFEEMLIGYFTYREVEPRAGESTTLARGDADAR